MAIYIDGVRVAGIKENSPSDFLQVYEATITPNGWFENPNLVLKTQVIEIPNITSNNTARIDHSVVSIDNTAEGYDKFIEEEKQYGDYITTGFAETIDGGVRFVSFAGTNTVDIPIVVEVT